MLPVCCCISTRKAQSLKSICFRCVVSSCVRSYFTPQERKTSLLLAIKYYMNQKQCQYQDSPNSSKERDYVIKRLLANGAEVNGSKCVSTTKTCLVLLRGCWNVVVTSTIKTCLVLRGCYNIVVQAQLKHVLPSFPAVATLLQAQLKHTLSFFAAVPTLLQQAQLKHVLVSERCCRLQLIVTGCVLTAKLKHISSLLQ